jgi:hypothetical protein
LAARILFLHTKEEEEEEEAKKETGFARKKTSHSMTTEIVLMRWTINFALLAEKKKTGILEKKK